VVVIKKLIIVLAFVFIVSLFSVSAQDYLALQGSVTGATTGNVVVEIWSAASGGTLLYNSTTDFNNVINNSRYDILVGNGTQPLSLNFSGTYYMNLNIAGKDMDFNSSDRQVFQSPIGNITTSRPIKTYSTSASALNVNDMLNISGLDGNVTTGGKVLITSTDADDALNVSAGGANIFGNTVISGKVTLQSTDTDDALNVSLGGLTVAGGATIYQRLTMLGKIASTNTDPDDALNVSVGGAFINEQLKLNGVLLSTETDIDDALNISDGGSYFGGAVVMNGKTTIRNSDTDDALNVSLGGVYVFGTIKSDGKVSGNRIWATTSDADDALNVTTGGSYFKGAVTVNNDLNVNSASSVAYFQGKLLLDLNDADDALNVSSGGANIFGNTVISGKATLQSTDADDALNVSLGGLTVAGGSPGDMPFKVANNGAVQIRNNDADDALNVSLGGLTVAGGSPGDMPFKVANNGAVQIRNNDADDALNVSSGGAFIQGNTSIWGDTLIIGNPNPPGTNMQNHLTIYDGKGQDKCAYLTLYDEGGVAWYLYVNTTGDVRINNAAPSTCATDGEAVGSQP
jgi:hypothetical protein